MLPLIILAVGTIFGPMSPTNPGSGGGGASCGATSCITTQASSDLITEGGSNIVTES